MKRVSQLLAAGFGAVIWISAAAAADLPSFNHVTVTVVGDAGQNMESLNKYADDFLLKRV